MIMINATTALVYDTDDLKEAVDSDNGIDLVYFGADITLAYGITIFPGKQSLTFDGTFEGIRYTFTDMNSSVSSDTIGIRATSNITITFQNINMEGRNFYGIPYIPSNLNYSGVSTIYENVTYNGTQINYNPYGFTRFTDCNITVNSDEVAETRCLELSGDTTIVKTNESNATFWFRGDSSQRPYIKILAGSNVTVNTANYFIYENYPPDFIIEPGSNFSLSTNSGVCYSTGHTINSFLLDMNSSCRFIQTSNSGSPSLCIDGGFTVNENANFYMESNFPNTSQLIRFMGNAGNITIDNPKSFVLYNRGSASAMAFYFSATITVSLSGGQVNYWESAMTFPAAGTYEDTPDHKWNRPDYGRFTLQGTASNSTTNITFNDFTPEELADLPPLSDLQLANAQVLSIGNPELTVYSSVISRGITGLTEPYANVRVMFIPTYYVDPNTVISGSDGTFLLVPTAPVPFSDYVEVSSNIPFLIVSVIKLALEEEELFIRSAPIQINFPATPIDGFPGVILPRDILNSDSPVYVIDTRLNKTAWQLWVNISGPLQTDENDILPEAVVFIHENDVIETVENQFKAIYTGHHPEEEDEVKVTWDENKGVLARITAPIHSGKRYSTTLGWVVAPTGIIPEGVEQNGNRNSV